MISVENLGGMALVLASMGLMLIFALIYRRAARSFTWRQIAAYPRLRSALGLAVEQGKRLHLSLGKSSLLSPTNASAFTGLTALEGTTRSGLVSDRPPLATSGDGALSILSQDKMRSGYSAANALEHYEADRGRMGGATPLSYIAGTLPVVHDERAAVHILIGNFGPEVALINEAAEAENAYVLAASDNLTAQAVLYGVAQDPLVGEETFSLPAYLQTGATAQASLRVQDILRWVIILLILAGAVLKLFGFL